MDTTCHLSLVLWLWARGSFCVDSEGKIQDYSVPFICSFPVCSYSDPAPILAYIGGVSIKHNSDGLTTQKHRRLCMIGWLQCSALFFHPQCVPHCPKMSHNVSHIHMRWLPHTCAHIIQWRRLLFCLPTDKGKNKEANKENNLSRWHWEFEKEKTYLRQKSTGPI